MQGFKIGKIYVPGQLQASILMRAFKENEFKSIAEAYENAKKTRGRLSEPTGLQFKMAKMRRDGDTPREISDKLSLKNVQEVYVAMTRVAVWEYFRVKE